MLTLMFTRQPPRRSRGDSADIIFTRDALKMASRVEHGAAAAKTAYARCGDARRKMRTRGCDAA